MKKLTIAILFLTNFAHAQFEISDIPKRCFTAGLFGNAHFEGVNTGIEGGMLFPKHWINVGVAVNPIYYSGGPFQNWALNINYNYLPNSYSNRFDLFFDFNYTFALRHSSLSVYHNDVLISSKDILPQHDFSIGLGFNTNLSQNLYLKTGFGAGVAYYIGQTYNSWYLSGNARISLGYRFGK